jgi:hypothetical protein
VFVSERRSPARLDRPMLGQGNVLLGIVLVALAATALVVWSRPTRASLSEPVATPTTPIPDATETTVMSMTLRGPSGLPGTGGPPCEDRVVRFMYALRRIEPTAIRGTPGGCRVAFGDGLVLAGQQGTNGRGGASDAVARYLATHKGTSSEIKNLPERVVINRAEDHDEVRFFTDSNWIAVALPSGMRVDVASVASMYAG